MPPVNNDKLRRYREKRKVDGTPEPFGGRTIGTAAARRFVVHHHAARNTHYDLRLEMDGVLRSWAVPKGPSPNMADKRFAALVEDHPIEYGDFEGQIPDGNYGAGWSIIWDKGTWTPIGDPEAGLEAGKLLFDLNGFKLRGRWTLVRMKGGAHEWLLIKERDGYEDDDGSTEDYPAGSVFTGLSLADLAAGRNPASSINRSLAALKVKRAALPGSARKPMLATVGSPFNRDGWIFEIKYDGYRLICCKDGDKVELISRNGNNLAATFPEITEAIARLPFEHIVIDGEAVVHDAAGMPSFASMQRRGRLTRSDAVARAALEFPATLYAFDLLAFGEFDLRDLPLIKRKAQLGKALPAAGLIRYSDHIEHDGQSMFEAASELGLEGIVGKKASSRYRAGRSGDWIKMRVDRTDDFVVMGYRAGDRGNIRSLSVGQYVNGDLRYSGNVGSGLKPATTRKLADTFETLADSRRPDDAPEAQDLIWKSPELVCEVRFTELTPKGQLRHPVFLRMRDDKAPTECTREIATSELPEPAVEAAPVQREIHLSNTDKLFWPDDGFTKGDLIDYYRAVSPWLLPWLENRPLVLTRYPDGIDGKSFFQKDAPDFVPEWLHIERLWSESTEREIGYFIVDSEEALVYLANMAAIPLHVYHSRTGSLERPDWCVLDLDPKEAPFTDVVTVARAIHRLCDDIGLPNYVKTSGSTGLHILLPLGRQFTFEQSRTLGELLGRIIVHQHGDICTLTRDPARREGKVYIDCLQNGAGKLIASAYCVRPRPGAPISMPVRWREVTRNLRPDSFNIVNALPRLRRMKTDPALPVITDDVDLMAVLEALTDIFREIEG